MFSGRTVQATLMIGMIGSLATATLRAQDRPYGPALGSDEPGAIPSLSHPLLAQRSDTSRPADSGETPAPATTPESRGSSRRTLRRPGAGTTPTTPESTGQARPGSEEKKPDKSAETAKKTTEQPLPGSRL